MDKSMNRTHTFSKLLIVISAVLVFLYAFTVSHVDCNTITTWGYDLLESIRRGGFRDYPTFTYEAHNMATNYSLFSNVINAIWLLPVYIIDVVFNIGIPMIVYDYWYTIMLVIIVIICVYVMNKVLVRLNIEIDTRIVSLYLMITSSILLIATIGKGQIDIFDMLCVILALYFYTEDRISLSFLMIGIGCLFKPFIILLGVPYLCLMVGRCKKRTAINTVLLVGPLLMDKIVTTLLMPEYSKMKEITEEAFADMFKMTHLEQVFNIRVNSVYVFLALALIICAICLYIGRNGTVTADKLLFYPVLMFITFAVFVESTTIYWYTCIIPLLILMGLRLHRISDFLILNLIINATVPCLTIFIDKMFMPGKIYTVFDGMDNGIDYYDMITEVELFADYGKRSFATLFIVAIILIVMAFIYESRRKITAYKEVKVNNTSMKALLVCQSLPTVIYLIMAYIM